MCGRFTQQRPTSEIARIFEADDLADDPGGRFNVAPTDEVAVVVAKEVRRAVVRYRWGLIPAWSDDPRVASRTFNARAETLATSGMFRDAFRKRRCIVPVDGFYEWLRDGAMRRPMRIHDPSGSPLALAGLWAARRDPETGIPLRTFTIVTTGPNAFMERIHNRMPVVLPADDWATWLDPEPRHPGELRALLEPRDGLPLAAYEVSTLVNSVRNNGPELIEPTIEPEPPLTLLPG